MQAQQYDSAKPCPHADFMAALVACCNYPISKGVAYHRQKIASPLFPPVVLRLRGTIKEI